MSINDSFLIEEVQNNIKQTDFGWIDYSFFILMLCTSSVIGIYFGFFAKKQETTTEYLLGGKTMGYFPIAMSMTASHLSGNTLLGIPAEVYQFGSEYALVVITTTLMGLLTAYIYLPVFYKLQLTSTFEYLEVRFAKSVRQFASVLFIIHLLLHVAIVVYVPALAFSQVTGFELHYITILICIVCIFYTTVGGLKAVVWTDTIQFIITVSALFTVLTLGIISVGGFGEVWRISGEGGRLIFFKMNPNPFVRTNFWGMTIGLTTNWIAVISVTQSTMQRFLAVPTMSMARKAILLTCIGLIMVKGISVLTGLIIYAKYHDCDPISTGEVKKSDQIVPYYLMDVAGNIPGLPGLFLASLVSAALSAMSGGLNAAAGIMWADFISPWIPESDTKERIATRVMKLSVVLLGISCLALVFIVEKMGEIYVVTTSTAGITSGTIAGLYTLGMMVPWANKKGAVIGGIIGFLTSTWIILGAQIHKFNGTLRYEELPLSADNCSYPMNMTKWSRPTKPPLAPEDEPMILFTISFLYYCLIGFIVVLICGTIISFLTGASKLNELNRDHFAPIVQRFLPPEKYSAVPMEAMSEKSNTQNGEKEVM